MGPHHARIPAIVWFDRRLPPELAQFTSEAAQGYAAHALLTGLPAVAYAATYSAESWVIWATLIGFILLVTPTGSPPSLRWRWWAWLAAAAPVVSVAFQSEPLEPPFESIANPLAVSGLPAISNVGAAVANLGILLAAVSLVATIPPGVAILPLAIGAAVLRYRLYELDRIINRARGRIQEAVDRRYNRRRYDAVRTIQAFRSRLRQEIDLDTLSAELLALIAQPMQPTQIWMWLRPPREGSAGSQGA